LPLYEPEYLSSRHLPNTEKQNLSDELQEDHLSIGSFSHLRVIENGRANEKAN
jgi:tellurite resistance-related uncharacterized protein